MRNSRCAVAPRHVLDLRRQYRIGEINVADAYCQSVVDALPVATQNGDVVLHNNDFVVPIMDGLANLFSQEPAEEQLNQQELLDAIASQTAEQLLQFQTPQVPRREENPALVTITPRSGDGTATPVPNTSLNLLRASAAAESGGGNGTDGAEDTLKFLGTKCSPCRAAPERLRIKAQGLADELHSTNETIRETIKRRAPTCIPPWRCVLVASFDGPQTCPSRALQLQVDQPPHAQELGVMQNAEQRDGDR